MFVWLAAVCFLAVQTAIISRWLIGSLANRWNVKAGELPYIMKVTIGKMLRTPEDVACSLAESHICAFSRGMKASCLIYPSF